MDPSTRLLLATALAALAGAAPPAAAQLSFDRVTPPVTPAGTDAPLGGAEPLVTFDPSGNGRLYLLGGNRPRIVSPNISFWASGDRGRTFDAARFLGTLATGIDADVTVGTDHTVYLADINGTSMNVCRSSDGGHGFGDDCEGGAGTNRWGFDLGVDRQWIVADPRDADRVYLAYKASKGGPKLLYSSDRGTTFVPCPPILDPAGVVGADGAHQLVYMMRPVVGRDGTLHVPLLIGGYGVPLVLASVPAGCSGLPRNTIIAKNDKGDVWSFGPTLARDGGGVLWLVALGTFGPGPPAIYVFRSANDGVTWSKPFRVGPELPNRKVHFPAVTGGLGRDQIAVGWYEEVSSGWSFQLALSYDGGTRFLRGPSGVMHLGEVVPGGDLREFASAATDPASGCVTFAIPRAGADLPAQVDLAHQRDVPAAPCLRPGAEPAGASAPVGSPPPTVSPRFWIALGPTAISARALNRGGRARVSVRASGAALRSLALRLLDPRGRTLARGSRRTAASSGRRMTVFLHGVRRLRRGRHRLVARARSVDGRVAVARAVVRVRG